MKQQGQFLPAVGGSVETYQEHRAHHLSQRSGIATGLGQHGIYRETLR